LAIVASAACMAVATISATLAMSRSDRASGMAGEIMPTSLFSGGSTAIGPPNRPVLLGAHNRSRPCA